MSGDNNELVVDEYVVLHKYEGDVTQEQIDSGEAQPIATITIHNGEVIAQEGSN